MLSRLVIASVFLLVSLFSDGIAEKNICDIAQNLVMLTEISAKETFEKDLRGWPFSGTGFISDIKGDPKDNYLKFSVSCGNDVLITFEARNFFTASYKVGQKISFSGKCTTMKKGVYKNTGNRYVLLGFENTTIKIH